MIGKKIDAMNIGDYTEFEKTITETDVYLFSDITGDFNLVNINSVIASKSIFKRRVVHGILTAGLISAVLGRNLPGVGTVYLLQNLKFIRPVYINDTIKVRVELIEVMIEKNIAIFKTICTNQDGVVVVEGEAKVMPLK